MEMGGKIQRSRNLILELSRTTNDMEVITEVEKNKVVAFHYIPKLDSGKIIDTTTTRKPLHILVGYHQVIPG
jgi:hypothetical protein